MDFINMVFLKKFVWSGFSKSLGYNLRKGANLH